MAGNSRPSFLKRQKEQKRLERANEKRAVRQARREARASGQSPEGEFDETRPDVPGADEGETAGTREPDDAGEPSGDPRS